MPMEQRVAIVTGGVRGLGRAMTFGLAREGHKVLAIGHIDADVGEVEAATAGSNFAGQILPLVADLRQPADCDRVVPMALSRFGGVHILVNNAGLTFTTIDPARFRRPEPQKFWQVAGDIVRAVLETHYPAPPAADCRHSLVDPSRAQTGHIFSELRACSNRSRDRGPSDKPASSLGFFSPLAAGSGVGLPRRADAAVCCRARLKR